MNRFLADTFSTILHPLMLPTYAYGLLFFGFPLIQLPFVTLMYMLGFIFIASFLLPIISILLFYKLKLISSYTLINRKDRILPSLFTIITYFYLTYICMVNFRMVGFFLAPIIAITAIVLITSIITFFWKISIHTAAVGGFTAFLLIFYEQLPENSLIYLFLASLVGTGFLISSRLFLNLHTPAQTWTGTLLGFSVSYIVSQMVILM